MNPINVDIHTDKLLWPNKEFPLALENSYVRMLICLNLNNDDHPSSAVLTNPVCQRPFVPFKSSMDTVQPYV